MSAQERTTLFGEKTAKNPSNIEVDFIENKIKNTLEKKYRAITVPNTIYQLFVLYYFFNNPNDQTMTSLYLYLFNFFENFSQTMEATIEGYRNPHFKFTSDFFDQCKSIYNDPIVASANFAINCSFGRYYLEMNKQNKSYKDIAADLITKLIQAYEKKYDQLPEYMQGYIGEQGEKEGGLADGLTRKVRTALSNELEGASLKSNGIISGIIDLEVEANQKNKAILMRGTKVFSQAINFPTNPVQATKQPDPYAEQLLQSALNIIHTMN